MPREHGDKGEFVETVALDDVLGVFDHVDGPVVLSADVADALGCTTETARRKLKRLHERGELDRRKVARRVLYWRATEPTPSERRETVETPAEGTADQSDRPSTPDEHSPSPVDVTTLSFDRGLTAPRREQLEAWLHYVAETGDSVTKSDFADWWTDARAEQAGYNAKSFWEAFAKAGMKQADEFVKPTARSYRYNPGDQNTADPLDTGDPSDPTDEFDT
jgi:hypothetical protein